MKIEEHGLYAVPKDWAYIESWIMRYNYEDRIHLLTAAMMTWNLAAKITNEEDADMIPKNTRAIIKCVDSDTAPQVLNEASKLWNDGRQAEAISRLASVLPDLLALDAVSLLTGHYKVVFLDQPFVCIEE